MQEAIVFILFFGIIAYVVVRRFREKTSDGCSTCAFNEEGGKAKN